MGFGEWVKRGATLFGSSSGFWVKVSMVLSLLVGFWLIPLAFATDTENGRLTWLLLMIYGLILWIVVGLGLWFFLGG